MNKKAEEFLFLGLDVEDVRGGTNVQTKERRRLTILYSTSKGTKYIQGPPGSLDRSCVGGNQR